MAILSIAQYAFNPFSIPPLIVGVLVALLGISAFFYERRFRVKISFLLMTFSAAVWLICYSIVFASRDPAIIMQWCRLAHIGVCFIPGCMLLFIASIFQSPPWFRKWAVVSVGISFFFCLIIFKTDLWLQGITSFFWGYYPQYGNFSGLFLAFFFTALFSGLGMLGREYRSALSPRAKARLKSLIIAFSISFIASIDYFANYGIAVYPGGYIAVLIFVMLTANTMRRYHLSDLNPAFAAPKILETMQGIVLVLDLDGIIRVANHSACEILGYEEFELVGKPGKQIIKLRETDTQGEVPLLQQLLEHSGENIRGYPMRWLAKDGRWINLSVSASVLRNRKNGKQEGIVYAALDLTEHLRTEQALRESEDRFQLVTENVRDYAIFMLDEDGNVQTWNLGAERIKSYQADEIVGKHFSLFYPPEDIQNNKPEHTLQTAKTRGFVEDENWRMRKDGSRFWAHVTLTALRNRTGELQGFLKITRDITEKKRTEEALRESEDRFRSVTESANDAIVAADSEGKILSWNQGAKKMFGYDQEEILGKPLTVLMPEKYREAHQQGLKHAGMTGEARLLGKVVELAGMRKNGEEFPIELSLSSWKTKKGTFYSGIIRDITQRKQLQGERDRYFNLSLDMLCISDFDGYFHQLNPAWEKTLGWTAEELMAKPAVQFVHPEDRRAASDQIERLKAGITTLTFENRYLCKNGSYKYLLWSATVPVGEKMIYAAARDITELKKHREMQIRLATIVESSVDAILMVSLEGEITSWNRGAEKIYRYPAADIIGKSISLLFTPNRIKEIRELIYSLKEGGGGIENYETICIRQDGNPIQVSLTISPIKDEAGNMSGISLIGRNITKVKEAEKILRHQKDLEMKASFISMVSHELRTPLTVIKMGVDILESGETGKLNPQQAEWVEMCSRNIARLTRLITKVLDFQKLEADRMEYDFKEDDLNKLILELDQPTRLLLKGKKVELKFNLAPDLPKIRIDPDKITEVLTNILDNSVKFTAAGAITVQTEIAGEKIKISIRDTGLGIKNEDILKLFSSFTQVHDPAHKTGGSGLGLAISKKIIEQHRGRIWVESEYGKGTVFYIELPLR